MRLYKCKEVISAKAAAPNFPSLLKTKQTNILLGWFLNL
jgi:hypothetical protein